MIDFLFEIVEPNGYCLNGYDKKKLLNEFKTSDVKHFTDVVLAVSMGKNDDDINNFSKLIKQNITDKTKSLWFPKVENEKQFDKTYES